ncbi:MAG: elongation factor P [Candidatus Peregrinibacteria bacterium]|nr:elongation factor P [Candidatus Peregrinibacteria bacterium]
MAMTTDIKKGLAINFKNGTWLVIEAQFVNPGKGGAFTRAKIRNLKSNQVIEYTFKAGESVDEAEVSRRRCQYLYNDGSTFNFMDNDSYEQFSLTADVIGNDKRFLTDGIECYAMHIDGVPASIELSPKMDFKVITTTPGIKGDTATGGSKDATIETGATIKVPLFVKEGDMIKINTSDASYVSKAN